MAANRKSIRRRHKTERTVAGCRAEADPATAHSRRAVVPAWPSPRDGGTPAPGSRETPVYPVSLATVYNALHQFTDAGLLQQVIVEPSHSYFDTNIDSHQHFYDEDDGRLTDISADIGVSGLPTPAQRHEGPARGRGRAHPARLTEL